MVRYHYREGVKYEKKKNRWFLIAIGLIIIAAAMYVAAIFIAPRVVSVPLTSLTPDAVGNKIRSSHPGQYGDHLFLPQINVDVAVALGGDKNQLNTGAWQRHEEFGDPAHGGTVVLSAHKFMLDTTPAWTRAKSPFYNLGSIKEGDDLTLDYKGNRYTYRVDRVFNAAAHDELERKGDDARLTLYAVDQDGNQLADVVVSAKLLGPAALQATNNSVD